MFRSQLVASEVFFSLLSFALLSSHLLILSKTCLLILPSFDFDGLISLNDGEFRNPSLLSLPKIKASVFCICWILSPNFNFSAIYFASEFILLNVFFVNFFIGFGYILCKITNQFLNDEFLLVLKGCGLSITIQCNFKTDFPDVTFDLGNNVYVPFGKENNKSIYILIIILIIPQAFSSNCQNQLKNEHLKGHLPTPYKYA